MREVDGPAFPFTTHHFDHVVTNGYESIKREPKIRGIYESRCDKRLQTKSKEFTPSHTLGGSSNWKKGGDLCLFVYYESMKRKLI
jgi:hypothetical protein